MRSTCFMSAGAGAPWRVPMRISSPLTRTSPPFGVSSRLMQRRKVDLPDPEEPRIATTSCSCAVSEMPFSTSCAPYDLWMSLTSSATGAALGDPFTAVTYSSGYLPASPRRLPPATLSRLLRARLCARVSTRSRRRARSAILRPWRPSPPSAATALPSRTPRAAARPAAARAPFTTPSSPRLAIAHLDCDAFYAAVEKRDDPSLADRPVIVGGGSRGVVSTFRRRLHRLLHRAADGVRSAMPMFKALKLCPEAVVIRPRMQRYVEVSRAIRAMMLALTPAVEPLSLDEAFLDLTGTERLHHAPPAVLLARLQARIERELGITASVGLSHNKFLAKIASDLDKPRGLQLIGRAETDAFLARQPVSIIWGVGRATLAALEREGIRTIADLRGRDRKALLLRFGSLGDRL